jgi:diguanylate cyclase (GGDEF)-like protein
VTATPEATFAFQPLLSTRTGGVVAVEALARPAGTTVYGLFSAASKAGRLVHTDIALATQAMHAAGQHRDLPIHLNLLAVSAGCPANVIDALDPAVREAGRHPHEVVLEIGSPFYGVRRNDLLAGVEELRRHGFRIALDGIGHGDIPLALLAEVVPDMIKIDARLLSGLPDDAAAVAVIEGLAHIATRTDSRLAAVGVETVPQLLSVSRLGVRVAQGNVLTGAADRPDIARALAAAGELARADHTVTVVPQAAPRVKDFMQPAVTLPEESTAEEVRAALADRPDVNGLVLVDDRDRPQWSIDRSRFLIRVTGPYGHALHAKKAAVRHADKPRVIQREATGIELLDLVGDADWERTGDDVVVTDETGRCVGVVRVTEVIRGVADMKIEQAMALNPLTRLPGTDAVAKEVDRRIGRGEMFVISWLDVDGFKTVNDTIGFSAGDDLIRAIGRAMGEAAGTMSSVMVGHVGGDDFLLVTDLDEIAPLASQLVDVTWSTEGIITSVSLASLVCGVNSVESYQDASRLLAPLKRHAKAVQGSSWVLGRPGFDRVDVLRGRRPMHDSHERAAG